MVRFGTLDSGDPLSKIDLAGVPHVMAKAWSKMKLESSGKCILANNAPVTLSFGAKGGGWYDDGQFNLSIGSVKVYYRKTFFPQSTASIYRIRSIFYKKSILTTCRLPPDAPPKKNNKVTCYNRSKRLLPGDTHLSPAELQILQQARFRDKLRKQLTKELNPFCKKFLPLAIKAIPSLPKIAAVKIPKFHYVGRSPNADISEANFDIDNGGKPDQVFMLSSSSTYFDGSYMVAFTRPIRHIQNFLHFVERPNFYNVGSEARQMIQWNGIFITSPITQFGLRYTQNIPFIYKDTTYIWSLPTGSPPIFDRFVPSGVIVKISSNNTSTMICEFP